MLLQTQLTDEMIAAEIAAINKETEIIMYIIIAAAAAIALAIVSAVIINAVLYKRTGNLKFKRRLVLTVLLSAGPLLICGTMGFAMFWVNEDVESNKEHADEWHLVSSTVQDLSSETETERKRVKRNGKTRYETRTTTKYYILFEGYTERRNVPEKEFFKYTEGEEVYLVISHTGGIKLIYSMDDYTYTGARMEEIEK